MASFGLFGLDAGLPLLHDPPQPLLGHHKDGSGLQLAVLHHRSQAQISIATAYALTLAQDASLPCWLVKGMHCLAGWWKVFLTPLLALSQSGGYAQPCWLVEGMHCRRAA